MYLKKWELKPSRPGDLVDPIFQRHSFISEAVYGFFQLIRSSEGKIGSKKILESSVRVRGGDWKTFLKCLMKLFIMVVGSV